MRERAGSSTNLSRSSTCRLESSVTRLMSDTSLKARYNSYRRRQAHSTRNTPPSLRTCRRDREPRPSRSLRQQWDSHSTLSPCRLVPRSLTQPSTLCTSLNSCSLGRYCPEHTHTQPSVTPAGSHDSCCGSTS